jgi:hypothetical protein
MVRKLLKSTVAGKPSFLTAGLRCRRSRLRRSTAPPRLFAKTKSSGLRYFDLCQKNPAECGGFRAALRGLRRGVANHFNPAPWLRWDSQCRRLGKSSDPIFSRKSVRSAGAESRSPLRSDERAQPAPLSRVPLRSVCSPAIEKMGLKNGDGAVHHWGLGLSAVCRKASIVVSASCFRRGQAFDLLQTLQDSAIRLHGVSSGSGLEI